jgi:DNA-binding NtrC family response regulator
MDDLSAVVVDDDPEGRMLLSERLRAASFDVHVCGDAYMALERVRDFPPDVIVTDQFLPGMLGTEFITRVRELQDTPIIGLSARATVDICDEMHRAGATRVMNFEAALDCVGEVALEVATNPSVHPPRTLSLAEARERRAQDEKTRFEALVTAFNGNISAIARHMNVDRSTVQYHLTRLGLR